MRGALRAGPAHSGACSALWPFRTLAPKAPAVSPLLYHTPSLCLSLHQGLQGCYLQFTFRSQARSSARRWLGLVGVWGRPFLLSSPQPEPCSAAPLQPAGGRPQAEKRSPGDRWPGAASKGANPPRAEGGDSLPLAEARSLWALVARGQEPLFSRGLAALPRRSAGGAGAPGLLTFARGVSKVARSCLLGRGRRELGSRGREGERSVGGGVLRLGQALCLHWGRGEGVASGFELGF